ncbi:MAG: hypothetical protein AAF687_05230 [Pseudomonadota bacterium]
MTHTRRLALSTALALAALSACTETAVEAPAPDPQDAFWNALSSHCGKAFAGRLVSEDEADADFVGAPMVMHVRECSDTSIAVPFHVELANEDGEREWDRSRTWLITRNAAGGLRLKHDHRHKDGTSDKVTMYGGDTASDGTARAQDFPVDAESVALFEAEGLDASVTNVWTVEIDAADADTDNPRYVYQLKRTVEGGAPEDRLFRVEFDLTQEVEAPPAAWGQD